MYMRSKTGFTHATVSAVYDNKMIKKVNRLEQQPLKCLARAPLLHAFRLRLMTNDLLHSFDAIQGIIVNIAALP